MAGNRLESAQERPPDVPEMAASRCVTDRKLPKIVEVELDELSVAPPGAALPGLTTMATIADEVGVQSTHGFVASPPLT